MRPNRQVSLFLLVSLGGCSIALSGPQANRARGEIPKCDTSRGMVAIDGITAGLLGLGGLAQVASESGDRTAGGLLLATAALYGLAALHGDSATSECRKAMDQYASEQRAVDPDAERPRIVTRARPMLPAQPAMLTQPADVEPTPAPVVVAPKPTPPPPPPPPPPPKPADGDPWGEFWREGQR